jgi:hypothetical protein
MKRILLLAGAALVLGALAVPGRAASPKTKGARLKKSPSQEAPPVTPPKKGEKDCGTPNVILARDQKEAYAKARLRGLRGGHQIVYLDEGGSWTVDEVVDFIRQYVAEGNSEKNLVIDHFGPYLTPEASWAAVEACRAGVDVYFFAYTE